MEGCRLLQVLSAPGYEHKDSEFRLCPGIPLQIPYSHRNTYASSHSDCQKQLDVILVTS